MVTNGLGPARTPPDPARPLPVTLHNKHCGILHAGGTEDDPAESMDAYLAAFARVVGYRMVTIDAAFMQLGGLDLVLLGST